MITNAEAGYDWSTFPERLQQAGITWKVYQDIGDGLDAAGFWGWTGEDPFIGNYGDNSLLYFHQFQNALPGNPLADNGRVGTNIKVLGRDVTKLVDMFRQDVLTGTLPQVSWIAAPEAFTEHPNWAPNFGAWYASQFLDALTSNPEVWSKTVFFINYDEDGGFFDHIVSPTPPANPAQGASTVSTINEIFPGDGGHPSGPYGLGVRVPLLVISPWSKGGWVNSEVFDHTSLIQFIEARFAGDHPGVIEPNITPWRRSGRANSREPWRDRDGDRDVARYHRSRQSSCPMRRLTRSRCYLNRVSIRNLIGPRALQRPHPVKCLQLRRACTRDLAAL